MRRIRPIVLLLTVIAAAPAAAQQAQPVEPAKSKPFVLGITANHMTIDPATASSQLVGERMWGMQFDGGMMLGKYLFAGVDFAPHAVKDRATFTQNTTLGEKSSTAMLMYFSAMVGARTPAFHIVPGLAASSFGVYGGASGTKGERSIDNCTNCYSEDIKVAGGSFVQPTVLFGEGRARLRVSDRYFLGDKGMRSVISLGMELGGR